jgi:hypothetical protein
MAESMNLQVIGSGSVGFTATGLDTLRDQVLGQLTFPADAEVTVEVPAFVVIAADVFGEFLQRNHLDPADLGELSDRQIARKFQNAELPHGLKEDLRAIVENLDGPLTIRPSSVLEETLERSIGGVYPAKLIPNHGLDVERRRRGLADAVKLIWASTYFSDAVNWRRGAGEALVAEQMAVVIQRAVGSVYGRYFYPTVSVVARSYNHYPTPGNEPGEGGVALALGFGKAIGEDHVWSYCPVRPTAPPPFKSMGEQLKYTQTSFWALDLRQGEVPDPIGEDEFMVRLGLVDAERDGTLELIASTYDVQNDRLRSGFDGTGPRVLTFAPLLRSQVIPFTSIIKDVMDQARTVTGREVEVEIAVNLDPATGVPVRFGILQLKTMAGRPQSEALGEDDLVADGVVIASENCLGNGMRADLEDIVYLKPAAFDRNQARVMAAELEAVNRGLLDDGRSAVFIGFGRWGTTDDRYGVPVRWGQISSAQAIVEITLADAPLNLSQGIHFFHHLLSQKVLYFSVEHDGPYGVDFEWMDEQEAVWEGRYVRHISLEEPVVVNVDGGRRRGLIRRSVD